MNSSVYTYLRNIIRGDCANRRLLFCINSARSGSNYLAELIDTAEGVTGLHEPKPTLTGKYLRMIEERAYSDTAHKRHIKTRAIKKTLRRLPPGEVYCETSNMFIKTFFDVVLDVFSNVEVIILRRELSRVLKSFIELGYFSPKNTAWPDWLSSPNARTAALTCIAADSELDQYDLCIAYLFDIEARAVRFQERYPHIKAHQLRVESLRNYASVEELFKQLEITSTDKTKALIGESVNVRSDKKKKYNNPTDLEYCKRRLTLYIEKAEKLNISLPRSLALEPYAG